MDIKKAIKQLEELEAYCGEFECVEIKAEDAQALRIAIDTLKLNNSKRRYLVCLKKWLITLKKK